MVFCIGFGKYTSVQQTLKCNYSKLRPLRGDHQIIIPIGPPCVAPIPETDIKFYDVHGKYGAFTNFYRKEVMIDEKRWKTTEHYFQAQKFIGTPYEEHIRSLATPREAFQFSRIHHVRPWIRNDWHRVKEDVMKKALLCKFSQNEDLKQLLLGTGQRKLIEHTANDLYWGDGGDGRGQNKLGRLLMDVRATLRKSTSAASEISCSKYKELPRSNLYDLDKPKYKRPEVGERPLSESRSSSFNQSTSSASEFPSSKYDLGKSKEVAYLPYSKSHSSRSPSFNQYSKYRLS